jgi:putative ABC transport system permease protein
VASARAGDACLHLLRVFAPLVPRWRRDEWLREWQAEIWTAVHRPGSSRAPSSGALVGRTLGAAFHALWLRQRHWMIDMLRQDLSYAWRMLRRTPAFTTVAVLTLALGIGATTAMFSLVHTVLIAPLPFADPDRLVQVWEDNADRGWVRQTCAPANYREWKRDASAFAGLSAYMGSDTKDAGLLNLALTGAGEPERVQAVRIAVDFFDVLGVAPALGRGFTGEAEWTGNDRVVVLSHGFWTRRFGADPALVGRTIVLDGVPREVRGVMPDGFAFPRADLDLWIPFTFAEKDLPSLRRPHMLRVVGRLKPEATLSDAQGQLDVIAERLERDFPDTNTHMRAGAGPLHDWTVGDQRTALLLLFAVVAAVLLIACANIANLVLARTLDRQRELAIRLALGATRLRVVRQVATECLVLAAAGGLAGCALAYALVRGVVLAAPPGIPRLDEVRVDPAALLFVVAVAVASAAIVGVLPALQGSTPRLGEWLKPAGRRGSSGSSASARTRGLLVTGEVAVSVVLLLGAVLLSRSLFAMLRVDPGFDATNVLTFEIALPNGSYAAGEPVSRGHDAIHARLAALPGVISVGATRRLPLTGYAWTGDMSIRGRAPDDFGVEIRHKEITPSFFETVKTPIVRGRGFVNGDRGTRVVLVNESLARRYFAGADPIGHELSFDRPGAGGAWYTIVGIVADHKQDGLHRPVLPEMYEPAYQRPQRTLRYVMRTASDPLALVPAVRAAVHEVDPQLPVARVGLLSSVIADATHAPRLASGLVAAFAATGLLLVSLGIYGMLAFVAARMSGEIGVRVALGAQRRDILRLVTVRGLWTVGTGLALGVVAALVSARAISAFLFGVSPDDPVSYAIVVFLLAAVAAAASAVPIRRATAVDPAVSLRAE